MEYFIIPRPCRAQRSTFNTVNKQIYTYLFVDDHTVGFIGMICALNFGRGNYLTKTAQVNLTWDAVAAKGADLIEQRRLIVPIKAAPCSSRWSTFTLTPEDSEKGRALGHEQQAKTSTWRQKPKSGISPSLTHQQEYIAGRDITDALLPKGSRVEDSKFRIGFFKLETDYIGIVAQCVEDRADDLLKKEQQRQTHPKYIDGPSLMPANTANCSGVPCVLPLE